MHMDPLLPALVGIIFVILALAVALRRFRQPAMVPYVLTGALLGPKGLGIVSDASTITRLGEIGVVLLLFFAGTELSIPELKKGWRLPVVGTLLQIAASVGCVWAIAWWLDWPWGRILLLGFVISLSSTAVVLKLLRDAGELDSRGHFVSRVSLERRCFYIRACVTAPSEPPPVSWTRSFWCTRRGRPAVSTVRPSKLGSKGHFA